MVYPHTVGLGWSRATLDVLLTGPIVLAVVTQSTLHHGKRAVYVAVGGSAALMTWLPLDGWSACLPIAYAAFFGTSTWVYAAELFRLKEVDRHTLIGAAITYVFLGLTFASGFFLLQTLDPGAVAIPRDTAEPLAELTYFSFVTLTTLGYGDVVPVSPAAKMLAVYEALVGQVFVAVAMASLVARHVATDRTSSS